MIHKILGRATGTLQVAKSWRLPVLGILLIVGQMLPRAAEAQALFQSGEGKGSFYNEQLGSLFLVNFSDKSIEFNQTHAPTKSDWRYGLRLKAIASEGYAALFEEDRGFGPAQGDLGGYVGWFWQNLATTRQTGLLDFRIFGDVTYSQASFSLAEGSGGSPVNRRDISYDGVRVKGAVNSFLGRFGPTNLSWGLSTSYGSTNNYKYLSKLQYCEEVAVTAGETTRQLRTCKDARPAESYRDENGWEATGDIVLWQPWLTRVVGIPGAVDLFTRYEEIRPKHPWSWGVGLFLSPKGKPQLPFGGLTFQWFGSDLKVGLQAGVSF